MNRCCPKCEESQLSELSRGVSKCLQCGGAFLAPGAVPASADALGGSSAESGDARGGQCPADKTIMTRTEIFLGLDRSPLHLERCSSCRGVWFDAGEWSALAERNLLDHLDELWSEEWRAKQREARHEEEGAQRLREAFGPELYDALQSVAQRLRGHERRSQALAFLREESA